MNEADHNCAAHGSPQPDGDDQTKARKRSLSGSSGRSGPNKRFRGEDELERTLVEEWTRFRRKLTDNDERRIFRRAEKEVEREMRERREARKQTREKGGNEDETGEAQGCSKMEERMDYDSSPDQRVSDKLKFIEEEFQRYWQNWKRQYERERMELALRSNGYHAAKARATKFVRDFERRHEEERPTPRSSHSQKSQRDRRSSSRERHKHDTESRDQGRMRIEEDRPIESTDKVKIESDRSPSRGESRTTHSSSYKQAAKSPPPSEDAAGVSSSTTPSDSSGKAFPFRYSCPLCQVVLNSVKQKEEHLAGNKHRSALVSQALRGTRQKEPLHSPLKSSAPKAQSSHQRLSPMGGKPATKQALSDMIQECKQAALSGHFVSVKPEPISGEEGPALFQLKSRTGSEPPSAQIRTAAAHADLSLSTPEHLDLDLNLVEPTGDKASVSAEPPAIPPGQVRVKEERGQTSFNSPSSASKPKVVNLFGVQVLVLDEEDQDADTGKQPEQRISSKEAKGKHLESAEDSEEVSAGESDDEEEDDEYEDSDEGEEDEDCEEMEMLSSDESTDYCEFSDEESGAKNDDEDELKRAKEERRKLLASLSVAGGRQTCKKLQQYIATKRNLPPWMLTTEERRTRWEAKYAQAKQFFSEHGRMPKQKESGLLWNWMRHAQTHWHTLDADQVEKLSALGVKPVKPRERSRDTAKAEKANTKKPKTSTAAEPTRRKKKKKNVVEGDWFVWDSRLRELAEYRTTTNGHNPPYFVPVGRWLYEQIAMQNRGLLKPERKAALEKLGVKWDFQEEATTRDPMSEGKHTETKPAPRSNTIQTSAEAATKETVKKERKKRVDWTRSYQELVEHLKQGKGKDPPKGSQLEKWLRRQRYRISKGQLAETRTAMLSALGVIPSHLINTQQATKSEKVTETKPKEETTKPVKRTPRADAAPDSSSEAVSPSMRELLRRIRSSQQ